MPVNFAEVASSLPKPLREENREPCSDPRGNFTMTMPVRGPKQPVTWFTDRPIRGAGHIPMDKFVSLWGLEIDNGFKTGPRTLRCPSATKSPSQP